MPIQSRAHILLAEYNLERAQQGEKPLTVSILARMIHVAPSSLYNFMFGRTTRVDFGTLYKLMQFFNVYDMNVMLVRIDDETDEEIQREIREENGEDEGDGGDAETGSLVGEVADQPTKSPDQPDKPTAQGEQPDESGIRSIDGDESGEAEGQPV